MLAKFMPEILELINKIKNNVEIKDILLKAFIKILQDSDSEVNSMACNQLDIVSENLAKEDSFDKVLECLQILKSEKSHM